MPPPSKRSNSNTDKSKPFLAPGHNYLGPGNQAQIAGNQLPPVDSDDLIASQHDNAYHVAKTKEDIYAADKRAISDFAVDAWKNKNWHSAVGAIGLGAKHGIERLTNKVFYPNLGKSCPTYDLKNKKPLKKNHGGLINIILKNLVDLLL